MEIKAGKVLIYHTADAFDPITGHEYNKHDEKELIESIRNNMVTLYSFYDGHRRKVTMGLLTAYIKSGVYSLTEEEA